HVTGVQTCALPISRHRRPLHPRPRLHPRHRRPPHHAPGHPPRPGPPHPHAPGPQILRRPPRLLNPHPHRPPGRRPHQAHSRLLTCFARPPTNRVRSPGNTGRVAQG